MTQRSNSITKTKSHYRIGMPFNYRYFQAVGAFDPITLIERLAHRLQNFSTWLAGAVVTRATCEVPGNSLLVPTTTGSKKSGIDKVSDTYVLICGRISAVLWLHRSTSVRRSLRIFSLSSGQSLAWPTWTNKSRNRATCVLISIISCNGRGTSEDSLN